MNGLSGLSARGDIVRLARTDSTHLSGKVHAEEEKVDGPVSGQSFGTVLNDALNRASDMEQDANKLTQQFITNPDSVDVHDVTIAMGKANLAVSMTKSVVDGALKAYREIINIR